MPKLERIAAVLAQSESEQADLLTAIAAFGNLQSTLTSHSSSVKQIVTIAKQYGETLSKVAKVVFGRFDALDERISALENKKPIDYAPTMRKLADDIEGVRSAVVSIHFPEIPVPRETDLSPVLAALSKLPTPVITESPKREYRMEVEYDQWGDVTGAKFIQL